MPDKQPTFPPVEITPVWARLNDELCRLVALVPAQHLDWSPKPGLWDLREILLHIAGARDLWMDRVGFGEPQTPVSETVRTIDDVQRAYERTWSRRSGFLADGERLGRTYNQPPDSRYAPYTGHWVAFHLLEHDIHHRADVFHYLALLGVETPGVGTP